MGRTLNRGFRNIKPAHFPVDVQADIRFPIKQIPYRVTLVDTVPESANRFRVPYKKPLKCWDEEFPASQLPDQKEKIALVGGNLSVFVAQNFYYTFAPKSREKQKKYELLNTGRLRYGK